MRVALREPASGRARQVVVAGVAKEPVAAAAAFDGVAAIAAMNFIHPALTEQGILAGVAMNDIVIQEVRVIKK